MQKFYPLLFIFLSFVIVSCTTIQPSDTDVRYPVDYKYDAWALSGSAEYQAINTLLIETDNLINDNALDAAADKLERVLRIKPRYAPAWSRLSWVTMQSNEPARSIEMAKRSNSFAQADQALLLLNWTFIRAASQMLGDEEGYRQADQKIESLKQI
jgi:hypothetical protein